MLQLETKGTRGRRVKEQEQLALANEKLQRFQDQLSQNLQTLLDEVVALGAKMEANAAKDGKLVSANYKRLKVQAELLARNLEKLRTA
ncbi:hypothetical protein [Rufibacter hautae]|uniref:Uncharacterized protein n=1 Tax=Rufibacter hautae TaxID=2595005 RepID=A0A5B6TJL2_9BACT|nr:hypothetical protein [Rufibacter hautae]KAA3439647.1 hypothetical protein FOA19_02925 [Rufibacter hautae]